MNITQTTNYAVIAELNKPVHDLHFDLYPNYFKQYDEKKITTAFKKLVSNTNHIFLLLEDEKQNFPIGYAWVEIRNYPENPFKKGYHSLYVHQLNIIEAKRNKGYGSQLMEYIYSLAREKEIALVELDYWVKNGVAKNFYKKHGFIKYREFVYKEIN
ncbi:GNAT family N-acetyltransferase [Bacillus carboniphilus]|uniref:GNAT family N-acetyltransferase n=1 Tax=Bacillus carboniphilus TaxID=86663 RepID=A0ABY9JWQ2_9BACI|nr:GNAT family N-acetyltransferase [Bacillus carboniphilus]WLR43208.1 GNAT family N-acetyltransferase [Bacillus carboniphilus]